LHQFPEVSFDVAYLNAVLHWLPDKPAILGERKSRGAEGN
jgi:trans-aconitate methyltransferase